MTALQIFNELLFIVTFVILCVTMVGLFVLSIMHYSQEYNRQNKESQTK